MSSLNGGEDLILYWLKKAVRERERKREKEKERETNNSFLIRGSAQTEKID